MNEKSQILIQKLRLKHGWSQEQLATLSGLSVRTIQRLEQGTSASAESLKAVAAVFDVDFNSLKEETMEQNTRLAVSSDEKLAFRKVRAIKGFYIHIVQYLIVCSILATSNLVFMPHYFWAGWVMFGWGSGVLVHGLKVFEKIPFLSGNWERNQVEKYLGRRL
jgi:transcriptional regulator with XRE-family HTH domain